MTCLSVMAEVNRLVAQLPERGRRIVEQVPLHDVCNCDLEDCSICQEAAKDDAADWRQRERMGD